MSNREGVRRREEEEKEEEGHAVKLGGFREPCEVNRVLAWAYDTDDERVLAVTNPRIEADGDESGVWHAPTYDKAYWLDRDTGMAVELTEEEYEDWNDEILSALHDADWSGPEW